jgi:hypothetical protein
MIVAYLQWPLYWPFYPTGQFFYIHYMQSTEPSIPCHPCFAPSPSSLSVSLGDIKQSGLKNSMREDVYLRTASKSVSSDTDIVVNGIGWTPVGKHLKIPDALRLGLISFDALFLNLDQSLVSHKPLKVQVSQWTELSQCFRTLIKMNFFLLETMFPKIYFVGTLFIMSRNCIVNNCLVSRKQVLNFLVELKHILCSSIL